MRSATRLDEPAQHTRRSLATGTAVWNMSIVLFIATGSFADSPALVTVIAYCVELHAKALRVVAPLFATP